MHTHDGTWCDTYDAAQHDLHGLAATNMIDGEKNDSIEIVMWLA